MRKCRLDSTMSLKSIQKGVLTMNEISYTMQGDYQLPNLELPEQPEVTLGRYAQMRRKYLKENHRVLYYNLLTQGKLTEHLAEVQHRALSMEETLVFQMREKQGITEQLKETDFLSWVRKMNNLRHSAQEIVLAEVVYA